MLRWIAASLLACTAISAAAYTAAWKLPGKNFVPDPLHSEQGLIRQLDSPPGESKFFQPGDELWDITRSLKVQPGEEGVDLFQDKAREELPWQGEWAVWNARSGMVVARGAWNDLFLAETALGFRDLPHNVRVTLELESGAADQKGVVTRSLSLASLNDTAAEIRIDGFHAKLEPVAYMSDRVIDLRLSCAWPAAHQDSEWRVDTVSFFHDGERQRIARHGTGNAAWTLFSTAASELIDGTTLREARLLEGPEGPVMWLDPQFGGFTVKRLPGGLVAGLAPMPSSLMNSFTSSIGDAEDLRSLPDVEAPETLAEWVHGHLIDFREPLRQHGVSLNYPGAFAGYHLLSQYLYIVASPPEMDICEQLTAIIGPCLPARIWTETNAEAGAWGIACMSGEKAMIERTGNEREALRFAIEPVAGGDGQIFDIHLVAFDIVSGTSSRGKAASRILVQWNVPQPIATYRDAGGKELPIIVTVRAP